MHLGFAVWGYPGSFLEHVCNDASCLATFSELFGNCVGTVCELDLGTLLGIV